MEKNVQLKYRLYRRHNGVFYWQENNSPKQGTLRTNDRREAERLVNAMNESHRQPTLNLNLARAYLAAHDPRMAKRTWQAVMDEMATHGIPTRAVHEAYAKGALVILPAVDDYEQANQAKIIHLCANPRKLSVNQLGNPSP